MSALTADPMRTLDALRREVHARAAHGDPVDLASADAVARFIIYAPQGGELVFDDDGAVSLRYDAGQGSRVYPEPERTGMLRAVLAGLVDSCRDVAMALRMLATGR